MHIWRSLRPDGAPCIFHLEYDPETIKIKKGLMFPLSPELDDDEPLMGECIDFTMDSLRNQMVLAPIELELETLGELNETLKKSL
tara:strand:- start:13794 stop:14048 length:255 start_codon:yes stop_codon:yes gene_type:complete